MVNLDLSLQIPDNNVIILPVRHYLPISPCVVLIIQPIFVVPYNFANILRLPRLPRLTDTL
jgi:hypothetical protein